jgi:hypothetical protein
MLTDDGQIFAKVNAVFEVGDTRVPFANLVEGCRSLQPLSQSLLAHPGADRAQELEQTAFTEQIQVSSVDVPRVVEFFALMPRPGPAVIHPREAPSVKVSGPLSAGSLPARNLVGYDQGGECRYAQE